MVQHLKDWERVYGKTVLYARRGIREDMPGSEAWTDVYIKQGDKAPVNLSRCNGVNCGQPSLSHDGSMGTYIKAVD